MVNTARMEARCIRLCEKMVAESEQGAKYGFLCILFGTLVLWC